METDLPNDAELAEALSADDGTQAAPAPVDAATAPVADAAAPAPAAAPTMGEAIERGIAAWVVAHVHNSPLSIHTDAYNHLVTVALPALRDAILKEI